MTSDHVEPQRIVEEDIYVELTSASLDVLLIMNKVRRPQAGAIVLFAGTYFFH